MFHSFTVFLFTIPFIHCLSIHYSIHSLSFYSLFHSFSLPIRYSIHSLSFYSLFHSFSLSIRYSIHSLSFYSLFHSFSLSIRYSIHSLSFYSLFHSFTVFLIIIPIINCLSIHCLCGQLITTRRRKQQVGLISFTYIIFIWSLRSLAYRLGSSSLKIDIPFCDDQAGWCSTRYGR